MARVRWPLVAVCSPMIRCNFTMQMIVTPLIGLNVTENRLTCACTGGRRGLETMPTWGRKAATMTALLLAVASSASLGIIFRHTGAKGYRRLVVTAANYATATIVALVLWLTDRGLAEAVPPSGAATSGLSLQAILLGAAAGLMFFLAFILYQRAVTEHGAGTAGMYGKLGVLVPMLLSIFLWRELPGSLQWIGLAVALVAIVVSQSERRIGPARPALLLLLLAMGLSEFSNKIFEYYFDDGIRAIYLAAVFGTAFAISVGFLIARGITPKRTEVLWGIAVGVPNLFSSFFLIAALQTIPAAVAFPVFSAGSIAVIVLGAWIVFRDRPQRLEWVSLALTAIALVLVNL